MMRGNLWMIRRFGVRAWWAYRRVYKQGLVIDYAQAFSPSELAILGEHFTPAPWELS